MSLKSRVARMETMAGISDIPWPDVIHFHGAVHSGKPKTPGFAAIMSGPHLDEYISAKDSETCAEFEARVREYAFGSDEGRAA